MTIYSENIRVPGTCISSFNSGEGNTCTHLCSIQNNDNSHRTCSDDSVYLKTDW